MSVTSNERRGDSGKPRTPDPSSTDTTYLVMKTYVGSQSTTGVGIARARWRRPGLSAIQDLSIHDAAYADPRIRQLSRIDSDIPPIIATCVEEGIAALAASRPDRKSCTDVLHARRRGITKGGDQLDDMNQLTSINMLGGTDIPFNVGLVRIRAQRVSTKQQPCRPLIPCSPLQD